MPTSSIHPQGWVPIETGKISTFTSCPVGRVAFTPKGGCPLKLRQTFGGQPLLTVAFTPKGGCPLKRVISFVCIIPPPVPVAFTPKGGCPLKLFTLEKMELSVL